MSSLLPPFSSLPSDHTLNPAAHQLRNDIVELQARIAALPSDKGRLSVCEAELRSVAQDLAEGTTPVLRAAVILALVCDAGYYRAARTATGEPLYPTARDYCRLKLQAWGLGFSLSRISRLMRCGRLYLALVQEDLPTPRAAESLSLLLHLGVKEAVKVWQKLVTEAGGACPPLAAVAACIDKRRNVAQSAPRRVRPWAHVVTLAEQALQSLRAGHSLQEIETALTQLRDCAQLALRSGRR